MKKILCLFFLTVLLTVQNPCLALTVPAGTSILIRPVELVNSKDTGVSTINATVTEDVVIDKHVIFQSGARATINISEMEKARFWGKEGKLVINNGYVFDTQGNRHLFIINKAYYGTSREWSKACGVISLFFLWPLALFGFVKGGQAAVSTTTQLEVNLATQFEFEN